jgi:YgiT-type zinc finger domain-containing protein
VSVEEELKVNARPHAWPEERLVEKAVTYTLEVDGKLFVIENVPARVNEETGEQLFSPQTVERLQEIIHGSERPVRVVETPVFDYAA